MLWKFLTWSLIIKILEIVADWITEPLKWRNRKICWSKSTHTSFSKFTKWNGYFLTKNSNYIFLNFSYLVKRNGSSENFTPKKKPLNLMNLSEKKVLPSIYLLVKCNFAPTIGTRHLSFHWRPAVKTLINNQTVKLSTLLHPLSGKISFIFLIC